METGKGWILHPTYRLEKPTTRKGRADRIDFLSDEQAVVYRRQRTAPAMRPDPDVVPEIEQTEPRLRAAMSARPARPIIYFKDVPILGTPAMSFSLSGARRSGWLPPTVSSGSQGSAEVMVPYYFNIAPNRDLTVFPRYIWRKRGLQLGATGPLPGRHGCRQRVQRRNAHRSTCMHDPGDDGEIDPANPKGPGASTPSATAGWINSLHNQTPGA